MPALGALDVSGLSISAQALQLLRDVDPVVWREEAALIPAFYERFGDRLPDALWAQHAALLERLVREQHADTDRPRVALSA